MRLTPHEQEKLLVSMAALLAQQRRGRGLRLNYPEAVALLSAYAASLASSSGAAKRVSLSSISKRSIGELWQI